MNYGAPKQLILLIPLIAISVLISRLPFLPQYIYHWDEAIFEYATVNFNVSLHQPHPPGYILYILEIKLFKPFFNDTYRAMQMINILSAIISVLIFHIFAQRIFDTTISYSLILFYLLSPLAWFYSLIGLNYMAELPFILAFTLLGWQICSQKSGKPILLGVLFGTICGFRQGDLLLFSPMFFYILSCLNLKKALLSLFFTSLVIISWLIPLVHFSGGWESYLFAVSKQSEVNLASSVFRLGMQGILSNFNFLFIAFLIAFGPLIILIIAGFFRINLNKEKKLFAFLFLWILPSLLYYLFIHINKPGYLLAIFPPFLILIGRGFDLLSCYMENIFKRNLKSFKWGLTIFLSLFLLVDFLISDHICSLKELKNHDQMLGSFIQRVRDNFSFKDTIIIGRGDFLLSWQHLRRYLPEFEIYPFPPQESANGIIYKKAHQGIISYSNNPFTIIDKDQAILLPKKTEWKPSDLETFFPKGLITTYKGFEIIRASGKIKE